MRKRVKETEKYAVIVDREVGEISKLIPMGKIVRPLPYNAGFG
jgi:hypothetical protein